MRRIMQSLDRFARDFAVAVRVGHDIPASGARRGRSLQVSANRMRGLR